MGDTPDRAVLRAFRRLLRRKYCPTIAICLYVCFGAGGIMQKLLYVAVRFFQSLMFMALFWKGYASSYAVLILERLSVEMM